MYIKNQFETRAAQFFLSFVPPLSLSLRRRRRDVGPISSHDPKKFLHKKTCRVVPPDHKTFRNIAQIFPFCILTLPNPTNAVGFSWKLPKTEDNLESERPTSEPLETGHIPSIPLFQQNDDRPSAFWLAGRLPTKQADIYTAQCLQLDENWRRKEKANRRRANQRWKNPAQATTTTIMMMMMP